jgi:hypothetical protein
VEAGTDCTTNYRPVLSSEREPQTKNKAAVRQKKGKKKNLVMGYKGVPTPRRIGRMTVGHNINSTQVKVKLSLYLSNKVIAMKKNGQVYA